MKRLLSFLSAKEDGAAVIIVAISFAILAGFVALATDSGVLFLEHTRLGRAMDAAALSGAQELPDTAKAGSIAREYANRNGVPSGQVSISFSPDSRRITVATEKTVSLYFARFLGLNSSNVHGRSVAKISPIKNVKGLLPLGFNELLLPLVEGQEYMIKAGSKSGVQGWREILEYPGQSGADDFRESALNGFNGIVKAGDIEGKAQGNVSGPTMQGIQTRIDSCADHCDWDDFTPNCPRVAVVPIYRDLSPQDNVLIVGFATVFLERVAGNGQDSEVYARYVYNSFSGETDDSIANSYLYSVRLAE
jgi:hypothetical protein